MMFVPVHAAEGVINRWHGTALAHFLGKCLDNSVKAGILGSQ